MHTNDMKYAGAVNSFNEKKLSVYCIEKGTSVNE
jgi:hypothetical protein